MPIKQTIKGDLFHCGIPMIAHGCNAQGVMGSGVAKVVYDDYPWAYDTYRMMFERFQKRGRTDFLGHSFPSNDRLLTSEENFKDEVSLIFNLITQDNYGRTGARFVNYWAIASSFKMMNDQVLRINKESLPEISKWGEPHVAIPLIGAGLGGGDWNIIKEIINDSTPDIDITVVTL